MMTIAEQINEAQRAVDCLEAEGVQVVRAICAADQERPTIICQQRGMADLNRSWCRGCRIVWRDRELAPVEPPARDGCRVCGCTDTNACTDVDGLPCFWAQPGLCSRCAREAGVDVDVLRPGSLHLGWDPAAHEYGTNTPLPERPFMGGTS